MFSFHKLPGQITSGTKIMIWKGSDEKTVGETLYPPILHPVIATPLQMKMVDDPALSNVVGRASKVWIELVLLVVCMNWDSSSLSKDEIVLVCLRPLLDYISWSFFVSHVVSLLICRWLVISWVTILTSHMRPQRAKWHFSYMVHVIKKLWLKG